jgi:hypothetical protein
MEKKLLIANRLMILSIAEKDIIIDYLIFNYFKKTLNFKYDINDKMKNKFSIRSFVG